MDISTMLEVQVNEVKEENSKENVTPKDRMLCTTNVPPPITQDESNFYKLMFGSDVSAVRHRKLHCTACDIHIGSAPADAYNMCEHPMLRTLLCAKCREFYGDGTFEQGDDATDMFCRWCANGGNLYCCSFCSNTFCSKCIRRNFDPMLRRKIEADEKWKCFVCDPGDLYGVRAICWALLQHVQNMTRLIQNDCTLTQEQKDEKMVLDETECCPRRRKRKRRRTGSNSEEEDETYIPKQQNGPTFVPKRRKRGRGRPRLNGTDVPRPPISIRPKIERNIMDDISSTLLSCNPNMLGSETSTINTGVTTVPPVQAIGNNSRVNPTLVQPALYNATIMNVVTSNFLQSTPPMLPIRRIAGPLNQVNLYQTMRCAPTPMVTIPNQNASVSNRRVPTSTVTVSPNVIEIESDPDDSTIVGTSRNTDPNIKKKEHNNLAVASAVPVALVSSKNVGYTQKQELLARHCKTLNQRLLPHGREVDLLLGNLKTKLSGLFEITKRDALKQCTPVEARNNIRRIHNEMRNAVTQLAHINDRMIREYNRWKRYQSKTDESESAEISDNSNEKIKDVEVPLDMECINESDEESENRPKAQRKSNIIRSSDLICTTNIVDGIKFFRKRNTVDQAVGENSVQVDDKSVQINCIELQDYEKCIGHSVISEPNRQSETQTTISESTDIIRRYHGKYEEQFIFYLQHLEDQTVPTQDDLTDLVYPNKTPFKDLIEENSSFISEILESIDKPTSKPNSSEENNLSASGTSSVTCQVVDELVEMVNKITDDLGSKRKILKATPRRARKQLLKETVSQGIDSCTNEGTTLAINEKISSAGNPVTNADEGSSNINCKTVDPVPSTANEDECTIIDD